MMDRTTAIIIGMFCLIIFGSLIFAGIKIQNKALPKTTLRESYKNVIFTILIIYVLIACAGTIVYFLFNQSANNALQISIISLWIMIYLFSIFTWITNKKKAGYILLDVISFPNKNLFILFGCGSIALGISGNLSFSLLSSYSPYVSIIIGLSYPFSWVRR